jgi:hypothetical protein
MINWGVNCEQNVGKIVFVSVQRLFIQGEKKYVFDISFIIHLPICHLPAVGAKRGFHENGMLRYNDVASVTTNKQHF